MVCAIFSGVAQVLVPRLGRPGIDSDIYPPSGTVVPLLALHSAVRQSTCGLLSCPSGVHAVMPGIGQKVRPAAESGGVSLKDRSNAIRSAQRAKPVSQRFLKVFLNFRQYSMCIVWKSEICDAICCCVYSIGPYRVRGMSICKFSLPQAVCVVRPGPMVCTQTFNLTTGGVW